VRFITYKKVMQIEKQTIEKILQIGINYGWNDRWKGMTRDKRWRRSDMYDVYNNLKEKDLWRFFIENITSDEFITAFVKHIKRTKCMAYLVYEWEIKRWIVICWDIMEIKKRFCMIQAKAIMDKKLSSFYKPFLPIKQKNLWKYRS